MYLLCHSRNDSDQSLTIRLEAFNDEVPPYAILSHRWKDGELTFQDCDGIEDITKNPRTRGKPGYRKIAGCCSQALRDGYSHVWVDTCCIDKRSSAELSEAINSMYSWYEMSEICYAHLGYTRASEAEDPAAEGSQFRTSEWFTRGWTLQELIAPTDVAFFDAEWRKIGTKASLAGVISEITRVREVILEDGLNGHNCSVAEKMSWAAGRKTSREEDRAYSLLGLFGVHMPPIYGEGPRAFKRLQEEIMRTSNDHSMFSWQGLSTSKGILASSPDQFVGPVHHPISYEDYARVFSIGHTQVKPEFTVTNYGLHIQLPIAPVEGSPGFYYGFLACSTSGKAEMDGTVIYLRRHADGWLQRFTRASFGGRWVGRQQIETLHLSTAPLYVLLHEDTWPLYQDQAAGGNLLRPFHFPACDEEHEVVFTLAKTHHRLTVLDACVEGGLDASNEIHMMGLEGLWITKLEFGRRIFAPVWRSLIAAKIFTSNIRFERATFSNKSHLATLVVGSGRGPLGAKVLIVLAIQRGGWLLFVAKVSEDVSACCCREELLSENNQEQEKDCKKPSWLLSQFLGVAMPFSYDSYLEISFERYFVAVERDIRMGHGGLALRIEVGLRPQPKLVSVININTDVVESVVAQTLRADSIYF